MESIFRGCGGLKRTDFSQFLYWQGVVNLKDLIFTVSSLGGCGVLDRTDFYNF